MFVPFLLAACQSPSPGPSTGASSIDIPVFLTKSTPVTCADGSQGVMLTTGYDTNNDQKIDSGAQNIATICQPANWMPVVQQIPVGDSRCATGGMEVDMWKQYPGGNPQFAFSSYACTALVPIKFNMPSYGFSLPGMNASQTCRRLDVGYDTNGSGTLDSEEVTDSTFWCEDPTYANVDTPEILLGNVHVGLTVDPHHERSPDVSIGNNTDWGITRVEFDYSIDRHAPDEIATVMIPSTSLQFPISDPDPDKRTVCHYHVIFPVAIGSHEGFPLPAGSSLFVAWQTGPNHFTLDDAQFYGIAPTSSNGKG